MIKFIVLFLVTLNVYAVERKVPEPDIAERGEMQCFDLSQALHKALTNIQQGADPDVIITNIMLNNKNVKKGSNLIGEDRTQYFNNLDNVTNQIVGLVRFAKKIYKEMTPTDAQMWYYDSCVIEFHKQLLEYKN